MFIVAQIFGTIALILELFAFQLKKKKHALMCQGLDAFFYLLQYLFLGAYSGCVTKGLVIVRNICVVQKDQKKKEWPWLMWIFIAVYIISGILTFESWYSLLPIGAALLWVVAIWKIKDAQGLRWAAIPSTMMWLVYNVLVLSIPGMISNILSLVSVGIGLYRYRQKTQTKKRVRRSTKTKKKIKKR